MKLRGPSLHAAGMTIPLAMKDLRLSGCPVAQTNPYSQMTAEQRLRFALWLQEAEKQNMKVLKDLMVERGPIRYRDGNEGEYLADD